MRAIVACMALIAASELPDFLGNAGGGGGGSGGGHNPPGGCYGSSCYDFDRKVGGRLCSMLPTNTPPEGIAVDLGPRASTAQGLYPLGSEERPRRAVLPSHCSLRCLRKLAAKDTRQR